MNDTSASPAGGDTAAATEKSTLYQLVEQKLQALPPSRRPAHTDLAEYIRSERDLEPPVPFHRIAHNLVNLTGVDLTQEAVRRWFHSATAAK